MGAQPMIYWISSRIEGVSYYLGQIDSQKVTRTFCPAPQPSSAMLLFCHTHTMRLTKADNFSLCTCKTWGSLIFNQKALVPPIFASIRLTCPQIYLIPRSLLSMLMVHIHHLPVGACLGMGETLNAQPSFLHYVPWLRPWKMQKGKQQELQNLGLMEQQRAMS